MKLKAILQKWLFKTYLVRDVFKIFDRDGDGLVSRGDVRSVTLSLGTTLSNQELDGFMRMGGKVNIMESINIDFKFYSQMMRRSISRNWKICLNYIKTFQ